MTPRALIAVVLLAASIGAGGRAAADVSYTQERELGKKFDMFAHETLPLVRDREIVSYVDDIGQEIVAGLKDSFFEYRFAVLRDGSINAFAVPGGYIYVNTGLLNHARNDDEVAAVLGHEVAHVHAHHMARQQEKSQLLNYASMLAMLGAVVQPALASIAIAGSQAAQLKYRREFEQEADYLGVRYLRETRYDPRAMLDFFKKLEDQTRSMPSFLPPYLLSHPMTEERLNHLEAVLRAKQWEGHERADANMRLQRVQALARAQHEKPQDVLDQYARLRADSAGNPNADYLFGIVALETGRLKEAEAALAIADAAGVPGSKRELGRLALRQRQPDRAAELLREHLTVQGDDATAWVDLAKALEAQRNTDEAKIAYRRALAEAPELESAHEGYGMLAGRDGDRGAGFYHLGLAAGQRGEYARSLDQLKRALPLIESDSERTARARSAIADLETYLEIEPSEAE